LAIQAIFHPEGEAVIADCRLLGSRTLPNQAEPQITTHFEGRVRLTKQLPPPLSSRSPGEPGSPIIKAANIYHHYFHGPAYQVLEQAWRDGDWIIGKMKANLPANHIPSQKATVLEPRLIELCFQTAGLWEMSALRRLGLPQQIQQVSSVRTPEAGTPLYAVVTAKTDGALFDADVVDAQGNLYLQLRGYRTVALSENVDTEALRALHAAVV
jgi:hypothetical protein